MSKLLEERAKINRERIKILDAGGHGIEVSLKRRPNPDGLYVYDLVATRYREDFLLSAFTGVLISCDLEELLKNLKHYVEHIQYMDDYAD